MGSCDRSQADMIGSLLGDLPPARQKALLAHVEACGACGAKLRELRSTWSGLPPAVAAEVEPPPFLREAVLAHARSAVRKPRAWASEVGARARRAAAPVFLGAVAAGLVVAALGARGLLGVESAGAAAVSSLALGGLLAALAGAARATSSRTVRSVLVASAAAFVGYVALTLVLPIPETVEFCRVRLLAASELTMSSLCLVYLAIAVLYAGLPAGLAAWLWSDGRWGPASILAQATLFGLLAAPVLGLHLGMAQLVLGLSALVGLGAGALAGAAVGRWIRARRLSGAFA